MSEHAGPRWRRSQQQPLNPTVEEDEEEDGDEATLVDEKELLKEIEISDDEGSDSAEDEKGNADACGVKRKRTIRVVIRSRAFL